MKYCSNCGSQAADNAAFCSNCGAPLKASETRVNGETFSADTAREASYTQSPEPAPGQFYTQPGFGAPTGQRYAQPVPPQPDGGKTIFAVIGFFFPVVGFILWLLLKGDREGDAKKAGKGALCSLIVRAVLGVIGVILSFVFAVKGYDIVSYYATPESMLFILSVIR